MNKAKGNFSRAINITQKWVEDFVVALNLCPFAAPHVINNSIVYKDFQGKETPLFEDEIAFFREEIQRLESEPEIETILIVLSNSYQDFEDYLDLIFEMEQVIQEDGYEGIYQIASFHPLYMFEGTQFEDAENYTNRSPYPLIHLIREESITKALESYKGADLIPKKNIELMNKWGAEKLKKNIASFFKD